MSLEIRQWFSFAILLLSVAAHGASGPVVFSNEPPGPETWEIEDGGFRRVFEVATDEIFAIQPDGKRSVQRMTETGRSIELLKRSAVVEQTTTGEVRLVLYEKGAPRNEYTRRVLTKKVLARLDKRVEAASLGQQLGAASIRAIPYAPGYFIFEARASAGALRLAAALRAREGVLSAEPMLGKKQTKKAIPNDPLFNHQWHLLDRIQSGIAPGVDLNVTNVWEKYRGRGITIGIVDDGLQPTHPDLVSNIVPSLGYDYRDGDSDPRSSGDEDYHATQVAGVAAARGNNSVGIAGVAFEASLASIRLVGGFDQTDEQNAAAMLHSNQVVHVSNNSWGANDDGETLEGPGPLMLRALETGARTGRAGKGTVYVWSAGNGGARQDNVNYDGYANSIYTIAVTALNHRGQQASYGEPGACLIVAAPADIEDGPDQQGITTTDLTGDGGQNFSLIGSDLPDRDYTQRFGGTSAVTPMVSGVIALMLQANPNLGWRDVQEILIRSAVKVDTSDPDWMTNGFGLYFNHKFGAGLVDASAAVALGTHWINLGPQTNLFLEQTNLADFIPDNSPAGITRNFDLRRVAPLRVEHATVTVDITHSRRGDLAITLISPSGTRSRLAEKHLDSNENYRRWTFMSVFNWGETSQGQWQVRIADLRPNRPGTLNSIRLELFGTAGGVDARPAITPLGLENGAFNLLVHELQGPTYQIQASANLVDWTVLLQTNLTSSQPIEVFEPLTTAGLHQFFRAFRGDSSGVNSGDNAQGKPSVAAVGLEDGRFKLLLKDLPEVRYEVQVSSNLLEWTTLLETNITSGQAVQVTEPRPSNSRPRFYRAVRRLRWP